MSWDSAQLATHVVKLLAEEVLGYNTIISGVGRSSASGLYAVAGCRAPNDFATDPQCSGSPAFVHHASLEVWGLSVINTMRQRLSAWPEAIPEDAGDMGYEGVQGTYIFTQQRQEAYQAEGLALEYYRSYDASWTRPWVYFDNYTSFDPAELRHCNETRFMDSIAMQKYVEVTGDHAGAVQNPDGSLSARCWHGSWWFAPACRSNPELCVPSVTGSNGWFVHDFMQRAAVFNMPMALTVAKTSDLWRSVSRKRRCLPYWWQPDSSFIDFQPTILTFPPYNALERAQNIRTSMADNDRLSKWLHRRLGLKSSRLREFVLRASITMSSINEMLLEKKLQASSSYEDVACNWVKGNENIWRSWIPVKTDCIAGKGLLGEDGSLVSSRANASDCVWCPPGWNSTMLTDQVGTTYICLKCEPGRSQANPGQSECSACEPGTFADAHESRECLRCAAGSYQNLTASSSCELCPTLMTTRVLGAVRASECVCPQGFYAPRHPRPGVRCEPCPMGMVCELASEEANVPRIEGARAGGQYPRPLPMFYTSYAEPLSPYRCLDERSCPGGSPNACGGNSWGIACGGCMAGHYKTVNHGCVRCASFTRSSWPLAIMVFLAGPLLCCFLYKTSQDPLRKWGSPMNCVSAAVFLTLIYLQIIGTVRTCYLLYPQVLSGSVEWMAFSLDFLSPLRPECSAFAHFQLRFIMRLLMPVYALLIFVATWLFSRFMERSNSIYHMDGHVMMGCFGGVYNTFFIGIASQTFSLFQCYEHPNKKFSLRSSPDVLCDSQTWQDLLVTAVIAIVVFCGGALTLFSYINLRAPTQFHDDVFRKKWRFLFMRFRPSVWWWGTLLLLKGMWLNLTTVIFIEGHLQLIWLTFAHVAYLILCFALLPWRSMGVAALDVGMHAMILLFFSLLPHFALRSQESEREVAGLGLVCCAAPLLGACVAVLAQLRLRFCPSHLDWQERAEQLCAVFGQINDVGQLKTCLEVLPTADIWTLEAAKCVAQSELLRGAGASVKLSKRLSMHYAKSDSRTSSQFVQRHIPKQSAAAFADGEDPLSAATASTSSIPRLLSSFRRSLMGSGHCAHIDSKAGTAVPGQSTKFVVV